MAGNDTRGWILASVSGVACIFGACIICVDYVVRLFPGKERFEIKRSDTFLSSSLSLSFGVMLFSALYSMLPEGKNSLMDGGMSKSTASYTLIGCFLGGVVGIQILSRMFHHFIPSHVVDCEHHHDDEPEEEADEHSHEHGTGHHMHGLGIESDDSISALDGSVHDQFKRRPDKPAPRLAKMASETDALLGGSRRPTPLRQRVSHILTGSKSECDEQGPCRGFSDPCGKECFNTNMDSTASPNTSPLMSNSRPSRSLARSMTQPASQAYNQHQAVPYDSPQVDGGEDDTPEDLSGSTAADSPNEAVDIEQGSPEPHHHHVPDNAFLSIGLQTSVAIALHKLPEGFITYATNHANPQLGLSIFVALFIHNITEGFALALPLFLAINSRWKAILAAAVLGGASQPIGAGIAELWFQAANRRGMKPNETVYGCMFAITSGIMTSVALQLFSESLGRTHNKTLCIVWAFVGMGILGLSSAMTA